VACGKGKKIARLVTQLSGRNFSGSWFLPLSAKAQPWYVHGAFQQSPHDRIIPPIHSTHLPPIRTLRSLGTEPFPSHFAPSNIMGDHRHGADRLFAPHPRVQCGSSAVCWTRAFCCMSKVGLVSSRRLGRSKHSRNHSIKKIQRDCASLLPLVRCFTTPPNPETPTGVQPSRSRSSGPTSLGFHQLHKTLAWNSRALEAQRTHAPLPFPFPSPSLVPLPYLFPRMLLGMLRVTCLLFDTCAMLRHSGGASLILCFDFSRTRHIHKSNSARSGTICLAFIETGPQRV
jgi:hypothetical protein